MRSGDSATRLDGDLVIWPESLKPGAQTTLLAANLQSGAPEQLPAALQPVRGTEFIATDGSRIAYLSPSLTTLYYSPAQDQPAHPILTLPSGQSFADIQMGSGDLAWTTNVATHLASTVTGAYSQVTPLCGLSVVTGSAVAVSDYGGKSTAPRLPLHLIDMTASSLPGC